MEGSELGPPSGRKRWRLLRRIGQLVDPESDPALARVESSLRFRIPRDASRERRLGAEALDGFVDNSASFPALIRGLAAGDVVERVVAVEYIQELAIRDMGLARELARLLGHDAEPEIAARARVEIFKLDDPGYNE